MWIVMEKRKAKVIKQARKVENIPVLVEAERHASEDKKQAEIRFIQDGEGGAKIEVTCPCGEKIVIVCEFETES